MKTVHALLLLAIISSLHHHAAGQRNMFDPACCRKVTKMVIPKAKVADMMNTPGHCAIKAVIITTKAKKQFCVDPESQLKKKLKLTTAASDSVISPTTSA